MPHEIQVGGIDQKKKKKTKKKKKKKKKDMHISAALSPMGIA